MAYVKVLPVASRQHLFSLIDYTQEKKKTKEQTLVTCEGCTLDRTYMDFMSIHQGQTRGKLFAHQIIQSFRAGEVTPEQAHELATELARKMLPGYQFCICTHTDAGHINNHIVFNAISTATGNRYHSNKASLALLQDCSDTLCREYGLSVIETRTGYRGLDRDTYELARKGKSWKVRLVNDLDDILQSPHLPQDLPAFQTALQNMGYFVKLTDRHITVTKIGEKKGIRLNTLARQFGMQYTKENIERRLCGEPMDLSPALHLPPPDETVSEWQRMERAQSEKLKKALLSQMPKECYQQIKKINREWLPRSVRYFGNCTVRDLYQVYGETVSIEVTPKQAKQMETIGIFYAGEVLSGGKLRVTFKAINIPNVEQAIGNKRIIKSNEERRDEKLQREIFQKTLSEQEQKIMWRCDLATLQKIDAAQIPFEYSRIRDGYRVGIAGRDLDAVASILRLDPSELRREIRQFLSQKDYGRLKRACAAQGDTLAFRVMSVADYDRLRIEGIECVGFERDNHQVNVAMPSQSVEHATRLIQSLDPLSRQNGQDYATMKRIAAERNEKLIYRVMTAEQVQEIKSTGISYAVFPKGNRYNVAFTVEEWDRYCDHQREKQIQQEQVKEKKYRHKR